MRAGLKFSNLVRLYGVFSGQFATKLENAELLLQFVDICSLTFYSLSITIQSKLVMRASLTL